ncbi:unnamed protein product, partial [Meganyctiphanes norvegica]
DDVRSMELSPIEDSPRAKKSSRIKGTKKVTSIKDDKQGTTNPAFIYDNEENSIVHNDRTKADNRIKTEHKNTWMTPLKSDTKAAAKNLSIIFREKNVSPLDGPVLKTAKGVYPRTSPSLRSLACKHTVRDIEGPDCRYFWSHSKHRFLLSLVCFAIGFVVIGFIVGLVEAMHEEKMHSVNNGNMSDMKTH